MRSVLLLLLTTLLILGCAGERSVEEIPSPMKKDWHLKQALLDTKTEIKSFGVNASKLWIYKTTVVKTSTNGGFAFVGFQNNSKVGYFKFTEEKLKLYNAINSVKPKSDSSVSTLLNEWDISHYDVKLDDSSGKVANREVEDGDRDWYQRRFFKINFAKANISEAADFPYTIDAAQKFRCWSKKSSHLVDDSLQMSDDYMTFVVAANYQMNSLCSSGMRRQFHGDYTYTVHYRYSFKPFVKTTYESMVYKKGRQDELLNKYGYFNTYREYLNSQTGRYGHIYYVNRWDPKKEHTFYFTKDFPERYKGLFHDIFSKTNSVFKENGLKIRFHLKNNHKPGESSRELGDIRYSFVNLIEDRDPSAPLGYGPSDANPLTGEIFSANLHMYTGYVNTYIKRLKDSFDRKEIKYSKSSLYSQMKKDLEEKNVKKWTHDFSLEEEDSRGVFNKILLKKTWAYPFWARFSSLEPEKEKEVFDVSRIVKTLDILKNGGSVSSFGEKLSFYKDQIKQSVRNMHHSHKVGHCQYPKEFHLMDAQKLLIDGKDVEKVKETIIYRTAIHELGHNLNLRHNFYGSVDKKNFSPERTENDDGGQRRVFKDYTSSVMDYLRLQEKVHLPHDWGAYDKAALLYAYSNGDLDSSKKYLYCTDEHRVLNAMCATWDYGTTPSEALFSHIESYEDLYKQINFRNDRGYWNTSGYEGYIFSTMWTVKKFLAMWRTGYTSSYISEELKSRSDLKQYQKQEIIDDINGNFQQSVKLALAFYNSVVQQSFADRDWRTQYEDRTGEVKKIGIAADKVYAVLFLTGDSSFMYNPNRSMQHMSYLTYVGDPVIGPLISKVFENAINERVDMERGFLGFGRALYALNATNYYNRGDRSFIDKIRVERFDGKELEYYFNIKTNEITNGEERSLRESRHPYFRLQEPVAIIRVDDYWYMAHKSRNPYSYNDMVSIIRDQTDVLEDKIELVELYRLYQQVVQ